MMTIDYPELDVLKDMPGYKAITRALLKIQIQQLVEQLASQTGDESVILTASVCDGTLCHLGTNAGKHFLEVRDEIKSQFLQHCIQRKLGRTQDTSTTQISQYEQTDENGASNRHHRQQWNANPNTHKQSSMSQGSFRKRPFHRQRMAPSWQRGHSGFGSTLMQQQGLGGARMSNPLHEFRAKQPRLHQARPPPKSTHSSWSQQELDETQNSALSSGAGPEVVQRSPLESETIDLSSDDDAHNLKMATASETDNSPRNMDDVDYEREKEQEEKETDDQHQLETGLSFTDSSLPEDYSKVETADVESRPTEAEIHTNSEPSIPVPVSLISAVSSSTSATTVLPPFASVRASSSKMDSNNSAVAGGHDLSVSGAPPLGMDQIDLSLIKAEPVSQDENQTGLLADGNVSGFPDAGWFQNVSAAELALHAAGGDNSASGSDVTRQSRNLSYPVRGSSRRSHKYSQQQSDYTSQEQFQFMNQSSYHHGDLLQQGYQSKQDDGPTKVEQVSDMTYPEILASIQNTGNGQALMLFTCSICMKQFSKKTSLENHIRIHTGEKPFACAYCDKRFTHSSNRSVHQRLHTGTKPYTCSTCNRQFSDGSNFDHHIRSTGHSK